ncbi:MAG: PAS domain-containing protein [Nitrospira sp.]|nr:PAS domain-containing protein [Nitrospira sp.]
MERFISTMLTRAADGAMLADEQGIVVLWNKAAGQLLGFRAGEVIGCPCREVMRGETLSGHPFCSLSCAVGHRLGCGVRNFDIQTHTKSGNPIWLNVSSSARAFSGKKDRFRFARFFRGITMRMRILSLSKEPHTLLAISSGHPSRRHQAASEHRKFHLSAFVRLRSAGGEG